MHGAVFVSTLCVLLAGVGFGLEGLNKLWSLPLGVGPGVNTDVVSFASDGTTIYTANTRGVLFAVEAATGDLLWSASGNNEASQVLLFPEVPDKLYLVSYGWFQQVTVQALRRSDGTLLGTLNNITGSSSMTAHLAVSGKNLAVWHNYGIMVTDQVLNPIWRRDASPNFTFYYSHVGANADLVATIYHNGIYADLTNAVSFDARTGAVVCNISNITDLMNENYGIPLSLTPSNLSVAAFQVQVTVDEFYNHWRLIDFGKCKVIRTYGINDQSVGYPAVPFLVNPGTNGELFVNANLSNSSWLISASPVSDRLMSSFLWSRTLTSPEGINAVNQFPVLGRLPFNSDAIAVWCNTMLFAVNTTTGAQLWSFPHRVPAAPTSQGQFVYPLGSGRLLVPNLEGYLILNIQTGVVDTVVEHDPIFASGAIASFKNATSQTPFVVYVSEDGSLVAAN